MTITYRSSLIYQRSLDVANAVSSGVLQVLYGGSAGATLQLSSSMVNVLSDGTISIVGTLQSLSWSGGGQVPTGAQIADSTESYVLVSAIPLTGPGIIVTSPSTAAQITVLSLTLAGG
jgi:hypothetical protein